MMVLARERKFSTEELFQATESILQQHGYEGFTFSVLAERMDVSRGALYKYYKNKDELITDYMIYEMERFLKELRMIDQQGGFRPQFEFLLNLIFKNIKVHQIIAMSHHIQISKNEKAKANKAKLDAQHIDMYVYLQGFIQLGKAEGILKEHIPDTLILGYIFQTIAIPNHFGIEATEWIISIKEILMHGLFASS